MTPPRPGRNMVGTEVGMGEQASWTIQGREVRLPCEVRHATSGAATFLVAAEPARRLLEGPDFELVEVAPGRGLLTLAAIDYRDNDLGDYNEVSIAFFVRPRGQSRGIPWLGGWADLLRGRLGVHIRHLPVDQSFTCEAGRRIWGYPKTVQQIDIDLGSERASCRLVYEGEHALTFSVPRGGKRSLPAREMVTYSYLDGTPRVTRATQSCEGFGVKLGGAEIELGSGPIAEELRSLGLPKRAFMTSWMEHFRASFGPAEKL